MTTAKGIEAFIVVYHDKLVECVQTMPDEYAYKVEDVPKVVEKMKKAFVADSYNIQGSPAIRKTCKALGISYTRKAIKAFISGT
jgi:hypothetical protein